jgi:hypothetical protein
MGLMVVAAQPAWLAGAGLFVFLAGIAWCGVQIGRRASVPAYLRLAVCCLAMVVMLAPSPMAQMDHGSMGGQAMAPSVVAVALALVLVGFVLVGVRRLGLPVAAGGSRAGVAAESLLAAAMAAMLVGLV